MRPLDGITVLDLTRLLPGAAATMLLADFGAEVIKIEVPGGDYARHMPPLVDGEGAVFRATNRGKKNPGCVTETAVRLAARDARAEHHAIVVRPRSRFKCARRMNSRGDASVAGSGV